MIPMGDLDSRIHVISTMLTSTWPDSESIASGFFFQHLDPPDPEKEKSGSSEGMVELCAVSTVPSGLVAFVRAVPNAEALGYSQKPLRDNDKILVPSVV